MPVHPAQLPDLPSLMKKNLTTDQECLLYLVAEEAAAQRLPLYIVGGLLRDLLLGFPVTDFDLVVEGRAIGLAKALAAHNGGKLTIHSRFGTARWMLPDSLRLKNIGLNMLDLVSARSETYASPAALPTVHFGDLADDLARRDFTINTLAVGLEKDGYGPLRDDRGGLADLKHGLVRALHAGSFRDDPTRIFRAVRYEQRYFFTIETETLAAIERSRQDIQALSSERVRHELDLILAENNAPEMLARLSVLEILPIVHPQLEWNAAIQRSIVDGMKREDALAERKVQGTNLNCDRIAYGWMLWLMHLSLQEVDGISIRLGFPKRLCQEIRASSMLYARQAALEGCKAGQAAEILDSYPPRSVQAVSLALGSNPGGTMLQEYLDVWRHVRPRANGRDLEKLGFPPGPEYQRIFKKLREAWLDGEIKNAAEERDWLDKMLLAEQDSAVSP
jgi:tRNA nucleotidyltransferase (CCA-adding enzyme)